jgi:RNA polymerase sigma-70 factor, ECF subfamily
MGGVLAGSPGSSHGTLAGLRFPPDREKRGKRQPPERARSLTAAAVERYDTLRNDTLGNDTLGNDTLGNDTLRKDADAEVARRVLAGDVEAFTAIVERWQGPLFRLALRYTNERESAEDLCQEAFLHAFRGLRRWRGEARFSTWLIALATNVYRSHARRAPPPEPIDLVGPQDPAAPLPAAESALGERVRRGVNALPARYRDALHLYYFHAADLRGPASSDPKLRSARRATTTRRLRGRSPPFLRARGVPGIPR